MTSMPNAARNREIFAAHAAGQSGRDIAKRHGLAPSRIYQILSNGRNGRTLTLLPGTEKLSPATRGLLIRMGYRSVDDILTGLARGQLRDRCRPGIAKGRVAEIVAWAREMGAPSKPAACRRGRPSSAPAQPAA